MAAGWAASNNQKVIRSGALKENDMLTGSLVSQKSGMDLMQNCDLPPPLKVFSGSDKTVLSSMSRVFGMMGGDDEKDKIDMYEGGGGGGGGGGEKEKLELLQALRLSQTRAREAERRALNLAKERDRLFNALLRGSAELSVYRQCVRLLEFQVSKLRLQWQQKEKESCCCSCGRPKGPKEFSEERKERQDGDEELPWFLASLALCLGIAGVGLALGYRYWC